MAIIKETWDEYRARDGVNSSTLKHILDSPAAMLWELSNPKEPTPAMEFGTLVGYMCETGGDIYDRYAVVPDYHLDAGNVTAKGERSTSRATSYVRDCLEKFYTANDGKQFIADDVFNRAQGCWIAAAEHKACGPILAEYMSEVTVTADIFGVPCKGRLDLLSEDMQTIVDIKTTRSINPYKFGSQFANLRYDFQLAFYRALVAANTDAADREIKVQVIAIQTERNPDACLFDVPSEVLDQAWTCKLIPALRRYRECVESGEWPGAAPDESVPLWFPNWAIEDELTGDWE